MKNGSSSDYAEHWFRDGIDITRPPAFFLSMHADMTEVQKLLRRAAEQGLSLTYAPVLVRAAALSWPTTPI